MQHKKTYRIIYLTVAISLGLFIVFLLSVAGDSSKGPIENILSMAEKKIHDFEDSFILQRREKKRKDKLVWFEKMSNDIVKLKHPEAILLGASDNTEQESFEKIINLEDSIHTTFPLIHIYNAWGSKPEEQFPHLAVETIIKLGSIPVITWEPWLSDFDEKEFPGIPPVESRDKNCLAAIAEGTYDSYISDWATKAKAVEHPVFIRLAHEMNDPYRYPWGPQNNSSDDFIKAWIHVHHLFESVGAYNIIWIWSPHPAYEKFDAYYPGDEYVDYVGAGVLNFGTLTSWSKWWTFDEIFGTHYDAFDAFGKPLMITEFGSLNVGGNRAEWFADALKKIPENYPSVKSVLFFHYPLDKTVTDKEVSWYFIEDHLTKKTIREQIKLWPSFTE